MPDQQVMEVRAVQYELQVPIEASRQRVWRGLTDQLSAWWLPEFHMLGPDSTVTLELQAGGRLYEQQGDHELLWYTVLSVTPEESLNLVGYCTPEFGGPLTTMLSARLHAEGGTTHLAVTDALYGHVSDAQVESLRSGWTTLFNDGLKAFLEA